jgi:hypothetical protein
VIAREYGAAAIKEAAKLAGLVAGGKGKAASEAARIAALNLLLDRGYGKAPQAIVGDADNPAPLAGQIEIVVVDPKPTIDRPPEETREQWLARRARELGVSIQGRPN